MAPLEIALSALLIPLAVALFTFASIRWLLHRTGMTRGDHFAAAFAIALGYLAGHAGISMPAFPPLDVTDRIPWLMAGTLVLSPIGAARTSPGWQRWLVRLLLASSVVGVILGPLFGETTSTLRGAAWLGAIGVVVLVSLVNVDALTASVPALTLGPALWIATGGAGGALLLSGSLTLGKLGLALASSLAGVLAWAAWTRTLELGPLVVRGLITTLAALVLDGFVYAELPISAALLLTATPLAIWLSRVRMLQRFSPRTATLVVWLATLIPIIVALAVAHFGSSSESSPYG